MEQASIDYSQVRTHSARHSDEAPVAWQVFFHVYGASSDMLGSCFSRQHALMMMLLMMAIMMTMTMMTVMSRIKKMTIAAVPVAMARTPSDDDD